MKNWLNQFLKKNSLLFFLIFIVYNLKAQDFMLYGIAGEYLVTIDIQTGDASEVATLTPGYSGFSSMTYEPNLDQLLAITDAAVEPKLVSIDRCSGNISEVGFVDQISPAVDFKLMESLEYNPNDGLLYAAGYTLNPSQNNWVYSRTLMTVDPLTGNASVITDITGSCDQEFDRLAFTAGATYGTDRCGNAYLYSVDVSNGSATYIGTNPSTSSNISVHPTTGALFSIAPNDKQFYSISSSNGNATYIGDTHTANDFGGDKINSLAFAPSASNTTMTSTLNDISLCNPNNATLTPFVNGGTQPYSYEWSNGLTDPSITVFPSQTSSYFVTITDACGSSIMDEVNVEISTINAEISTPQELTCTNSTINLGAPNSSMGAQYTYLWSTNNGNIVSGNTTLDPLIDSGGVYELLVTNTDNGCTEVAIVQVIQNIEEPTVIIETPLFLTCLVPLLILDGSDSSTGVDYSYQWSTMDGNIVSGENTLTPLVNEAGNYSLEITNLLNGCTNQSTVLVEENNNEPIATIDNTSPLMLDCDNTSLVLDGSGSQPTGNIIFEWTTNIGNIISGSDSPNPEVNAAGDYFLTVTNIINGCTSTQMVTVTQDVVSMPIAIIQTPQIITCDLQEVILDGSNSSQGVNYSYQWTTQNGNIVLGNNTLTATVNQAGIYILEVLDNSSNCITITSITVEDNLILPIVEAGTAELLNCSNADVILDGNGSSLGTNFIYEWQTNNGSFTDVTNGLITAVNSVGIYSLTVTNLENGCSASDVVQVEFDTNIIVDVLYDIPVVECDADFGELIIESVIGGTPPYLYSLDGTNFQTDQFFSVSAGVYTLYVIDANECELQVDFIMPDLMPFNLFLEEETTIVLGDNYEMNLTLSIPINEIDSITWTPSNNLSCSDCLNPIVELLLETTTFTVTVQNIYGCEIKASITIEVDKNRKIYIPNAFSPNFDGMNDKFIIYTGDLRQIKGVNYLIIFDRWGEVIYEARDFMPMDLDFGWDGTFLGKTMNVGVFVYITEIEFIDGVKEVYKGDITLMK